MIGKYKILRRKAFESIEKFENRLNEECAKGWRAISIASEHSGIIVLLERENKH
jgi:hypothetical protein